MLFLQGPLKIIVVCSSETWYLSTKLRHITYQRTAFLIFNIVKIWNILYGALIEWQQCLQSFSYGANIVFTALYNSKLEFCREKSREVKGEWTIPDDDQRLKHVNI
jgi:hypothetical protein